MRPSPSGMMQPLRQRQQPSSRRRQKQQRQPSSPPKGSSPQKARKAKEGSLQKAVKTQAVISRKRTSQRRVSQREAEGRHSLQRIRKAQKGKASQSFPEGCFEWDWYRRIRQAGLFRKDALNGIKVRMKV